MKNKDLILLDLFSGTGGFHKGLSDAGFKFKEVYYSEIDKHAIANYKYNHPHAKHIGSVENSIRSGIPRPHIITFGSPCQDFSLAGGRQGLAGSKSSLIQEAIAAITYFRPDVFIWENVKGTFSSNARQDFWAIIKAFADIRDYRLEWQLVNTSWILPQNRERIYLIGHLTTTFRNWQKVFPVSEDERLSDYQSQSGQRQSQTQHCSTIRCGYGGRADDTYIQTNGVNKQKSNVYHLAGHIWNGQDGIVVHDDGLCPTVGAGHSNAPKILVNSGNKRGYEVATEGDSINLQYPNSTTRRGRVGKQVAQTLDCTCKQGVIQLNPSTESNSGSQPYQQNRIYDSKGLSPALSADPRSPKVILSEPIHKHGEEREYTDIAPTIQARYGTGGDNIPYVDNIRRLTEIECERLQGFPDNWTQYGNYDGTIKPIPKTQRYKLLGNAVTAKMVKSLGGRILTNYEHTEAIGFPLGDKDNNRQSV